RKPPPPAPPPRPRLPDRRAHRPSLPRRPRRPAPAAPDHRAPLRWAWGRSLRFVLRRGDRQVARPSVAPNRGRPAGRPYISPPDTRLRWAWGRSTGFAPARRGRSIDEMPARLQDELAAG